MNKSVLPQSILSLFSEPLMIFIAVVSTVIIALLILYLVWLPLTEGISFKLTRKRCREVLEDPETMVLLQRLAAGPEPASTHAKDDLEKIQKIIWKDIFERKELLHIQNIVEDIEFWREQEKR